MTRRIIPLVERRTRPLRLPREEVRFLLMHARPFIEVIPNPERGSYNLTPGSFIGYIDGPTQRYVIGPRFPWPNMRTILGISHENRRDAVEAEGGLLAVLAEEFATRLEAVNRAGLVAGIGDFPTDSQSDHGSASSADRTEPFTVVEQLFDLHTPWNRIPRATATALLRRELPEKVRQRVEAAIAPLAVVPDEPTTDADFAATAAEPRAAGYLLLAEVCRLLLDGFATADRMGLPTTAFLVDLGQAFTQFLAYSLTSSLHEPGWSVEIHPRFSIGPIELKPDMLIRKDGEPWAALDACWKSATHDAGDVQRVLSYASVIGATRVGLVFPGREEDHGRLRTPDGRVSVLLHRLRVVGSAEETADSLEKLVERIKKG